MNSSNNPVGRPRAPEVEAAILTTTLRLLAECGYAGMTIGAVAGAAGVSRPTVYRRWSSKAQLAADSVRYALAVANPVVPNTGNPRNDVFAILRNAMDALQNSPLGTALIALAGERTRDTCLNTALVEIEDHRRTILRQAIVRGISAGHFCIDSIELSIDMLLGTIYFRFLTTAALPSEEDLGLLIKCSLG